MLEESELTVEQLQRVRDRPLAESYEQHDIGEEILRANLEARGLFVRDHGDDARHADEVYFGDGPDLAVYRDYDADSDTYANLVCYIEIKVKRGERWFGRCNRRHFEEYTAFSGEVGVPVFIWFALIEEDPDGSESALLQREAFYHVQPDDEPDAVIDITGEQVVFYEEDLTELDDGLMSVDGSDIIEVRRDETIVDHIPDVHGNEVIELDDTRFRSWPHFLHEIDD